MYSWWQYLCRPDCTFPAACDGETGPCSLLFSIGMMMFGLSQRDRAGLVRYIDGEIWQSKGFVWVCAQFGMLVTTTRIGLQLTN